VKLTFTDASVADGLPVDVTIDKHARAFDPPPAVLHHAQLTQTCRAQQ
jgi:hypothetical protein